MDANRKVQRGRLAGAVLMAYHTMALVLFVEIQVGLVISIAAALLD